MKKLKKTLNILHSNLNLIDPENLTTESLYYIDEKTGEATKIGEYFGSDALRLLVRIKKGINDKVSYSTLYQKSLEDISMNLSPNEIKVLLYLISKMGYENVLFGITYREISDKLSMSLSSVSSCFNKLMELNLLKKKGTKHKKIYHINPAIAWKGSRVNIRSKTYMFDSDFEKTTSFKDIKE